MKRCANRLLPGMLAAVVVTSASVAAALAAPGVPETKRLANGMPVIVLEDHTLPLVSVSLWVHAGSKDEIETSAGYAHFLEHLVQRGTDTTGPFEYQRLAHRWGGAVSVRANYDRTSITATGVSSALEPMVDAVAGMALRAKLGDKEIDQELGMLSQEVHNYYDEPSSVAFLESMRAAFPNHPYRFPPLGSLKTIGTLKHDPLAAFYKNLYVPNNMALVLAGDLDPARARELAERAFGKAPASATLPGKPRPLTGFAGHDDKEKPLEVNEPWTTLTFVGPGYRHPDRPAFEILARFLGEAGGSPIAHALARDRTGSSAQVTFYRLEDAGVLYVGTIPASPETSYAAATTALGEITALKKSGLKDDEVKAQVQRFLKEERQKAERLDGLSESMGEAALFGGVRYYWDLPDVYGRLTAADVNRVAAKYLVAENLRIVVIVPKKSGPLAEAEKTRFHAALDALGGMAKDAPPPGFEARLYVGDDAARVHDAAWGDPRDARAPRPPVKFPIDGGPTLVVQEDHRRSLAAVSLQLPAGSADDPPGKEGLAYLAGRVLSPAPTLPAQGEAVRSGGRLVLLPDIQVSRDLTEVRFLASPADLRPALSALAVSILKPVVSDAEFDALRTGTREALERAGNDPSFVSLDLFREKVYAGHPYAHASVGTASGLAAVTRADIETFLKTSLRPDGAVLAVAGDVDPEEIRRMFADLFGSWRNPDPGPSRKEKRPAPSAAPADAAASPASEAPAAGEPKRAAGIRSTAGEFTRLLTSSQSSVLIGVPGVAISDPDFDDLRLLGAGLTILAFEDIVFKRRAAFSATAIPEALRQGGSFALAVVVQTSRRDEAMFDLQRLMRSLAVSTLEQKDVDDFARVETGREATGLQGVLALASALSYRSVNGLGALSAQNGLWSRSAPPPDHVKDLAARYLKPESWIVIQVGPLSP